MKAKASWFAIILVLIVALTRFIGLPPNVAPFTAMALFGAAWFRNEWLAFILPVAALWASNLYFDNVIYAHYYDSFVWVSKSFSWVAGSLLLVALLGKYVLKKVDMPRIVLSSLGASVIFFVLTNFGTWLGTGMYAKDLSGLLLCFEAAIPFFDNTLIGDLAFCTVLFGTYEILGRRVLNLRPSGSNTK